MTKRFLTTARMKLRSVVGISAERPLSKSEYNLKTPCRSIFADHDTLFIPHVSRLRKTVPTRKKMKMKRIKTVSSLYLLMFSFFVCLLTIYYVASFFIRPLFSLFLSMRCILFSSWDERSCSIYLLFLSGRCHTSSYRSPKHGCGFAGL